MSDSNIVVATIFFKLLKGVLYIVALIVSHHFTSYHIRLTLESPTLQFYCVYLVHLLPVQSLCSTRIPKSIGYFVSFSLLSHYFVQ